MATLTLVEGYEHGVFSGNGGGISSGSAGTAPVIESTIVKSGLRSLKFVAAAGTSAYTRQINYSGSGTTGTSNPVCVGHFDIYVESMTGAQSELIHAYNGSGSAAGLSIKTSGSGFKIQACIGTTYTGQESVELAFGQWHCIDFRLDITTSTIKVDFRVNNTAITQSTWAGTAGTFPNLHVGTCDTTTATFYLDNLVLSQTTGDYPFKTSGELEVEKRLPSSKSASSNPGTNVIEDNTGADINDSTNPAYQFLDDFPISGGTDYVRQYATGTGNYAETAFEDSDKTSILGVSMILSYQSASTLSNNGQTRARDSGGVETTIFSGDMSETSRYYKMRAVANPSGGWTTSEVNALKGRVGYSSDASPIPYWHCLLIQVAYFTGGVSYVEGKAGAWNSAFAWGSGKESSKGKAGAWIPQFASARGKESQVGKAGSWNALIAAARAGKVKGAKAGSWATMIAGGKPSKPIYVFSSAWMNAFSAGRGKETSGAKAGSRNAAIAAAKAEGIARKGRAAGWISAIGAARGKETSKIKAGSWNSGFSAGRAGRAIMAKAAAWNTAFAGGLGNTLAVISASASAVMSAIAGGAAKAINKAKAGSANAAIGAARGKETSKAAASASAIAGTSARGKESSKAKAAAWDQSAAAGFPKISRVVAAIAGAWNSLIGWGRGFLTRYIPAAVERDVDPRIREAEADEMSLEAIVDYRNWGLSIATENAVWNPDLEIWTSPTACYRFNNLLSGASTLIQDQTIPHGGASCVRFNIDSSNNGAYIYPSSSLALVRGRRSVVRAWYRTDAGKSSFIIIRTSGGSTIYLQPDGSWSATANGLTLPPTNGEWKRFEFEFNSYTGYDTFTFFFGAGIIFGIAAPDAASSSVYFDDVSISPVDDGITREVNLNHEDGIDVGYLFPVQDGGLELWSTATNLQYWTETRNGASTINREATEKHGGNYSCRFNIDGSGNLAQIDQTKSGSALFVASKKYQISFWHKTSTPGAKIKPFCVAWVNSAYRYLQPDGSWKNNSDPGYAGYSYRAAGVESAAWAQDIFYFMTPAVFSSNQIRFGVYSDSPGGIVYVDDILIFGPIADAIDTGIVETRIREAEVKVE
jgi:hypothetical protein